MSENFLSWKGFSLLLKAHAQAFSASLKYAICRGHVSSVSKDVPPWSFFFERVLSCLQSFIFVPLYLNTLIWLHRSCGTSSLGDTKTSTRQVPQQLWAGGRTRPPDIPLRSQNHKRKSSASVNSVLEGDEYTRMTPGDNCKKIIIKSLIASLSSQTR